MQFKKPENLKQLLEMLQTSSKDRLLLAGGSDINIILRQRDIQPSEMIMINHLPELEGIKLEDDLLLIGATTTIADISASTLIKKHCPFLAESLVDFASPLIAGFSTIAGNIANSSPTADTVPLLLVLNARLILRSKGSIRKVPLAEFYKGYKSTVLKPQELIYSIEIPLQNKAEYSSRYIKVGSRSVLTIAKLSLAMIKDKNGFRIAAGSLNEYPRRLIHVEKYLNYLTGSYDPQDLRQMLKKDVTPITDFRSDAEYRLQVCWNYLVRFMNSLEQA